MKALSYRKKVARMMVVIVTVFALCVTPLHIVKLITEFGPGVISSSMVHIKVNTIGSSFSFNRTFCFRQAVSTVVDVITALGLKS